MATTPAPAPISITPVFVADLAVEGERMPVYVHVIDHPDALVETRTFGSRVIYERYRQTRDEPD